MNVAVIIILITLVVILSRLRTSSTVKPDGVRSPGAARKRTASTKDAAVKSPYQAVSINPACAAAQELEGERYLVGETPLTPIPGCSSPNCRCKYIHHSDRRRDEDRRDPLELGWAEHEACGNPERRTKWWRRETDEPTSQEGYDWIKNLDWDAGSEGVNGAPHLYP